MAKRTRGTSSEPSKALVKAKSGKAVIVSFILDETGSMNAYKAGAGLGIKRADTYAYQGRDTRAMFSSMAALHARTVRDWQTKG